MMSKIIRDMDVRRSIAYLGVSLAVAGIKSMIEYMKQRRSNGN
ncbi:MAG TPA: hypothetical protein VF372_00215 [Thermodesulfobacteriota bacterium]